MHACLGDNWMDLFDIVIAQANKPLFQKTESIFYEWNYKQNKLFDEKSKKPLGKKLKTVTQMIQSITPDDKILLEGSTHQLTNYF
jgi:hypothetical protein